MKETSNAQPYSAKPATQVEEEHPALNNQFSRASEFEVGRWMLDVGRFLAAPL